MANKLTKVKINNIDTSITYVYDPLMLLNTGSTLANTDVGFVFNRDGGVSSNVALYWNESTDKITIAYTTANGLPNSNIALTKYANVAADWYFGNLAGGTTNNIYVSANVLPTGNAVYNFGSPTARWNVGYFAATTLDLGGSQISVDPTEGFKFTVGGTGTPIYLASNGAMNGTTLSSATTLTVGTSASIGTSLSAGTNITAGGYVNVTGNILSAGAIHNSLTVNGNESVTGYINVTGNVIASVFNGGQLNLSGLINTAGNILSTGAIHNSLTVNGNHNATGYINTTANILAAKGIFNTIDSAGLINSAANVSASMFSGGQLYVSGLVNAGGNILAQTAILNYLDVNGNIAIGSIATPGAGHGITGNIQQAGAGTVWFNTPGNIMAALGRFGEISSDGLINTSANVMGAVGKFGTITSDGFINTSANISAATYIGGTVFVSSLLNSAANVITKEITVFGNATIGNLGTAGVTHSIIGNVNQTGAGTIFFNTPGNIMAAIGQFGTVYSSGLLNVAANILAQAATVNALTVNGNEIVTGYINSTGNVLASSHTGGTVQVTGYINTTANVLAAGGIFNSLQVNGNESVTGYLNVTGNILTASLSAGQINTTGNVLAQAGVFNGLTVNGNESVTGYLNVTGNILGSTGTLSGLTVNGNESVTGYLNVTGNVIATTAEVGSVESAGTVYANGTAATTSTTSGALRTSGGAGIAGNTVVGGILTVGKTTGIDVTAFTNTTGWFTASANSWVQFGLQNTNTGVGASTDLIAYAPNGDNNSGWIDLGITGQNFKNQAGQYAITGANDGYLFMSAPSGAGTGGNLFISTDSTGTYNDIVFSTGGFNQGQEQARFIAGVGLKLIQGTPSLNSTTGALQVVGGVGIGGNLNVQGDISLEGNLYLSGNAITFNTNNLSISDSLIYLATGNSGDIVDIGFLGHYINPGYQHTGLVRDASDGVWKLFSNVVPEPTTVIDFTNATYSNLQIGNLSAVSAGFNSNVTAAYYIGTVGTAAQPIITSVGTLTSLTSSGLINTSGNVLAAAGTFNALTVNGNESVTGYLNVTGNVMTAVLRAGEINTTGNVLSTGGVFNALTVNGNESVTGYLNVTGNVLTAQLNAGQINTTGNVLGVGAVFNTVGTNGVLYANGTSDTSSTTTGAIVVPTGGISVAGNAYVGKNLYVGSSTALAQNLITPTVIASDSGATYAQMAMINFTATGSSDYIAYPSDYPGQSNDHGWMDMGFTGTSFNDANYTITKAQDGYLFASGANASVGGNLVLATDYTGAYNDIVFGVGSFLATSEVARFHGNVSNNGNLWIKYTTPAVQTTTNQGALRVDGGIGAFGNISAGSLTTPGSQHTLFGNLQVNAIGFVQVAVGDTLQRPGTGIAGMIRFNTDTNSFEGYSNVWAAIGGGGGGGSTPGGVSSTFQYNNGGALGGVASMNYIVANSAIVISTGTTSTSTGSGALQIIGGLGITENINAGGYVKVAGAVNAAGNVLASQVSAGSVVTTGVGNFGGNVLGAGAIFNGLTVNGNIAVGALTVPGARHSIIGNILQTGAGTIFYNTTGNISASEAKFNTLGLTGTLSSSAFINTSGNISAATGSFGTLIVSSTAVVTNLNADLWDGNHFASYLNQAVLTSSSPTFAAVSATTFTGTLSGAAPAGSLSGSTLASGVTASSLTSVGTLTGLAITTGTTSNALEVTTINGTTTGTLGLHATSGASNRQSKIKFWGTFYNSADTGERYVTSIRSGFDSSQTAWSSEYLSIFVNNAVNDANSDVNQAEIVRFSNYNGIVSYKNILPSADNTYNLGSASYRFATVYGVTFSGISTQAKYADLAEKYTSDKKYVPGTVVIFGGTAEVTISTQSHDPSVAGVVSTDPGFLMNSELEEGVSIALQGRVPCRVQGPVKKGDRLVTSKKAGVACCMDKALYEPGCIIGKALEDILDNRVHTIEVVVGRV